MVHLALDVAFALWAAFLSRLRVALSWCCWLWPACKVWHRSVDERVSGFEDIPRLVPGVPAFQCPVNFFTSLNVSLAGRTCRLFLSTTLSDPKSLHESG